MMVVRKLKLEVSEDNAGMRLDKLLRRALAALPLGSIFKLLRTRKVRVNGSPAKAAQILVAGDVVEVRGVSAPPPRAPIARPACEISFRSLFEDEHLLIVDKPAGLAVHSGTGVEGTTLVDEVRSHLRVPAGISPTEFSPTPAHRLDRGTSGILIVAKTRQVMVALAAMFARGDEITKTYVALARGRMPPGEVILSAALAARGQSVRSVREHGTEMQRAVTHCRVVGTTRHVSLLTLVIETGRTHQIRRHLQGVGHPVAGDPKYGDPDFNRRAHDEWGLARMFLHAWRLSLRHPLTGVRLDLEARLPIALESVLERLELMLPIDTQRWS